MIITCFEKLVSRCSFFLDERWHIFYLILYNSIYLILYVILKTKFNFCRNFLLSQKSKLSPRNETLSTAQEKFSLKIINVPLFFFVPLPPPIKICPHSSHWSNTWFTIQHLYHRFVFSVLQKIFTKGNWSRSSVSKKNDCRGWAWCLACWLSHRANKLYAPYVDTPHRWAWTWQ